MRVGSVVNLVMIVDKNYRLTTTLVSMASPSLSLLMILTLVVFLCLKPSEGQHEDAMTVSVRTHRKRVLGLPTTLVLACGTTAPCSCSAQFIPLRKLIVQPDDVR